MTGQPKILVAYATRLGSTAEIAEVVGQVLREEGAEVEVHPVQQVKHIAPFEAVVLGGTIRGSRWVPEAAQFLEAHRAELHERPVAYFVVCLTMRSDTLHNRQTVMGYLEPILKGLPDIKPVDVGLFAGALDPHKLPEALRVLFGAATRLEGDFRDWPTIKDWAAHVGPKLGIKLLDTPTEGAR